MRLWIGLGSRIVTAIQQRAERKRLNALGPIGDFYRTDGNRLLYDGLPLGQDDWVIDSGGYEGEWTAGMLTRYGCHSELSQLWYLLLPSSIRDYIKPMTMSINDGEQYGF